MPLLNKRTVSTNHCVHRPKLLVTASSLSLRLCRPFTQYDLRQVPRALPCSRHLGKTAMTGIRWNDHKLTELIDAFCSHCHPWRLRSQRLPARSRQCRHFCAKRLREQCRRWRVQQCYRCRPSRHHRLMWLGGGRPELSKCRVYQGRVPSKRRLMHQRD